MPKCKMCDELRLERDRILKAYRRDKKYYLITIAILGSTLIYGKAETIDLIKSFF